MAYGLTEVDPVLSQHPCDPDIEGELYFPFAGAEVDVYNFISII